MITNYLLVRDWETGSRNPYNTQPVELAACIIDVKALDVVPNSLFCTLIKPEFDEEKCLKEGLAPVEDEALNVNKISRSDLENAIGPKQAWKDYVNYVKKYKKGKSVWDSPHVVGFNSQAFDDIIDKRMCEKYGPKLTDRQDIPIYHPLKFDLLPITHCIFNNVKLNSQNRIGMDSLREYCGIDNENAHRGLKDVLDCAFFLIKYLRLMRLLESGNIHLPMGTRVKYENCFENENMIIRSLLDGNT